MNKTINRKILDMAKEALSDELKKNPYLHVSLLSNPVFTKKLKEYIIACVSNEVGGEACLKWFAEELQKQGFENTYSSIIRLMYEVIDKRQCSK